MNDHSEQIRVILEQSRKTIDELVQDGGPTADDPKLYSLLAQLEILDYRSLDFEIVSQFRDWFGPALSAKTLQGHALRKPRGYAGDFEMIDRIYRFQVTDDPNLTKWDLFYHRQPAPRAVRNRKKYFHNLLDQHAASQPETRVLKIASGPGRSMYEWFCANQDSLVSIDCVELDAEAISFAEDLNRAFLDRITFIRANALRFKPIKTYDLIWSAGLFDYFTDSRFISLLKRLYPSLRKGGEMVIGNFGEHNPSRAYMEILGDWHLYHRSKEQLVNLALKAGIHESAIRVGAEPEGINLFLHITQG